MNKNQILNGEPLKLNPSIMFNVIEGSLNKDKTLSMAVRNGVYSKLLIAKEHSIASRISTLLLASEPNNVIFLRDSASLSLKMNNVESAISSAMKAISLSPNDIQVAEQALQIAVTTNHLELASKIALEYKDDWLYSPRFCQLAMLAFSRRKQKKLACEAANTIIAFEPQNLDTVTAAANTLLSFSNAELAKKALIAAGTLNSSHCLALFELGKSIMMIDELDPQAIHVFEKCLELPLSKINLHEHLYRAYIVQKETSKAKLLLSKVPKENISSNELPQFSKLLIANNEIESAISIYDELVCRSPEKAAIRKEQISLYFKENNVQKAQELYAQWLDERTERLPASFKDGIEYILASAPKKVVPQQRLEWMFNQLVSSEHAPLDKEHWMKRVNQGNLLDHYILDWLECRPHQANEIFPYFHNVQESLLPLSAALKKNKGAFLATAHTGVLFGGPVALELSQIKSSWLASVPDLKDNRFQGNLISTATENQSNLGRLILKSLKANKPVAIACDGGDSGYKKVPYPLFDQHILISEFIPRLSFRNHTPSFYPCLYWADNKIHTYLKELPLPHKDERVDDYVHRWCQEFVTHVSEFLLKHPTSIRGSGGFWTHLNTS